MTSDLRDYNRRCLECHTRANSQEPDCPQQTLVSDCVGCHMPKVKMNAPVSFTDHWTRVR
jgi:formate-dependent nitrite reductase cytochrome c552 subunit